ncbi:uncharacterized protein TNCV_1172071 [Trichonephila clavipes]|uniref:Uncharacterized protein n=1 Tax=Trichonephila clavipes TaxID=2585209 RepID=A0A8X6V3G0_TRICX|nr:uncharacterized protein TNCV_1172071 [Trichonephila clavipes]
MRSVAKSPRAAEQCDVNILSLTQSLVPGSVQNGWCPFLHRSRTVYTGKIWARPVVFKCLDGAVGSLVVRASDSRPEGLGSMLDVTKYPPSAHGFTCRNCGGGDRGRVAIYRPFGEVSLSLNRTVTCMVLKANDRRTSCPCHDEFRGPRSDYVRQYLSGFEGLIARSAPRLITSTIPGGFSVEYKDLRRVSPDVRLFAVAVHLKVSDYVRNLDFQKPLNG